jgi:hypothetical protein
MTYSAFCDEITPLTEQLVKQGRGSDCRRLSSSAVIIEEEISQRALGKRILGNPSS